MDCKLIDNFHILDLNGIEWVESKTLYKDKVYFISFTIANIKSELEDYQFNIKLIGIDDGNDYSEYIINCKQFIYGINIVKRKIKFNLLSSKTKGQKFNLYINIYKNDVEVTELLVGCYGLISKPKRKISDEEYEFINNSKRQKQYDEINPVALMRIFLGYFEKADPEIKIKILKDLKKNNNLDNFVKTFNIVNNQYDNIDDQLCSITNNYFTFINDINDITCGKYKLPDYESDTFLS